MPKFKPAKFQLLIDELVREQKYPTPAFRFRMSYFGTITNDNGLAIAPEQDHTCGTACCAMGTGVVRRVFKDVQPKWDSDGELVPLRNGRHVSWDSLGMSEFGITAGEFYDLFADESAVDRDLADQIAYMKRFLKKKTQARA